MARLLHQHSYPTLGLARPKDFGRLLVLALQIAVLGGIGLVLVFAIVNTILGTPQPAPAYSPYD